MGNVPLVTTVIDRRAEWQKRYDLLQQIKLHEQYTSECKSWQVLTTANTGATRNANPAA